MVTVRASACAAASGQVLNDQLKQKLSEYVIGADLPEYYMHDSKQALPGHAIY